MANLRINTQGSRRFRAHFAPVRITLGWVRVDTMKGRAEPFSVALSPTSRSEPATAPDPTRWWTTSEFRRSLPLFIAAAIFFGTGILLRFGFPADANYGPGVFAFWALLLALGFTCTIGGVISWTLAGDAKAPTAEPEPSAPPPAYLPIDFPEPTAKASAPAEARSYRSRPVFGRPSPEVRPVGVSGDFYEGPTDSERFEGPSYVLPIDVAPLADPEPTASPATSAEPVEEVLADLERIERDLAPRARAVEPSST